MKASALRIVSTRHTVILPEDRTDKAISIAVKMATAFEREIDLARNPSRRLQLRERLATVIEVLRKVQQAERKQAVKL